MTTRNDPAIAAGNAASSSDAGLPVGLPFGSGSLPANTPARRLKGETRGTNTSPGIPTKSPRTGVGGADGRSTNSQAHAPVGKRQLARLREHLSDRDDAVLRRIAEHRYLTSGHLQALCFTGHGSDDAAATTTRRVLRRLEAQQLIRRLTRRVGGVGAGSSATVWQLAPAGARIIREAADGYRTHEPSPRFLNHCLAVADVHVQLRGLVTDTVSSSNEPVSHDAVVSVAVQVEPLSWRSYLGLAGERRILQPDIYTELVTADYEDRWFIEVDCGTESMNTILKKCQQYEDYRRSGSEQSAHGVFPRVLWIMGGERGTERAERLRRAIRRSHELTPELYEICGPEDVVAVLHADDNGADDGDYLPDAGSDNATSRGRP